MRNIGCRHLIFILRTIYFPSIKEYASHKDYFSKLVTTGGYIEYFVGWFEGDHNLMATLSPELLRSTGELHIAIGIDAYSE